MSLNTKTRKALNIESKVKMEIDELSQKPSFWKSISPKEYFNIIDKQLDNIMNKFKLS